MINLDENFDSIIWYALNTDNVKLQEEIIAKIRIRNIARNLANK